MLTFLSDLMGGWTEVRNQQGFSYQVSRTGKRRVVLVDDYGRRGEIDEKWVDTGTFTDADVHKNFRNYNLKSDRRGGVKFASA